MPHRRTIHLVSVVLSVAALACSNPPEVLDAINRLPAVPQWHAPSLVECERHSV